MTHRVMRVSDYEFTSGDRLFLDANIWLYLVCPPAQKPESSDKSRVYSGAFADILKAGSRIYIDVLIISEFINRYARLRWEQWKLEASDNVGNVKTLKAFRNSPAFTPIAWEISNDARRVLGFCSRVESGFEGLPINDLLHNYGMGKFDFNDQVIAELCKREGLTLVTDDGDFKYQGLSILTENRRLLK